MKYLLAMCLIWGSCFLLAYGAEYFNRGRDYDKQGKLDEAIAEYKKVINIDPNDASAHYNQGLVYAMQEKFYEAIASFKEANRIDPNDADTHNILGLCYYHTNQLDEAISEYKETIRINPNHAKAHYNLGDVCTKQDNFEQALTHYKEFIQLARANPDLQNLIPEADRRIIQIAIFITPNDPNDPDAHNNLGDAYYNEGKLDEAIAEYEKAISIDSNYALAYYNLGFAYTKQGNYNHAISYYKKSIRLACTNPDLVNFISEAEQSIETAWRNAKPQEFTVHEEEGYIIAVGTEDKPEIVQARWITEALLAGKEIRLKYAQIEGDLELPEETEIKQEVYFVSATFTGEVDFQSATFTGKADFQSATFEQEADFRYTRFTGWAFFISATFTGKAQ